jgi:hypothetical protein
MTNDQIFKTNQLAYIMRHMEENEDISDPKTHIPDIINQIEYSNSIAQMLEDYIEEGTPLHYVDLLDCLASLGLYISSIVEDDVPNYASLAYFYSLEKSKEVSSQE